MESAIRIQKIVEKDGEIAISGLPCRKGEELDVVVHVRKTRRGTPKYLTARDVLHSDFVGLWEHRKDIRSSTAFARRLRRIASRRAYR
jgi:hypothetical protein